MDRGLHHVYLGFDTQGASTKKCLIVIVEYLLDHINIQCSFSRVVRGPER
jgi:hypothetical protein